MKESIVFDNDVTSIGWQIVFVNQILELTNYDVNHSSLRSVRQTLDNSALPQTGTKLREIIGERLGGKSLLNILRYSKDSINTVWVVADEFT